jgi:RNA polymerase sigma-70 factor (ECF subfamily)
VDAVRASDEDLWARSAQGRTDAFGQLFDRHVDAVYRYCFRRTGSWSDAEELTSITFLEAWRARGKAHLQDGSLRPWLLGVATNVDRNRRRAARRYSGVLSKLPRPEVVPDIADASVAKIDAEATAKRVLVELNRLPARDRDVAMLCLGQGLTYAEAAATLGIPIGTVRSRLSRARSRLSSTALGDLGSPAPEDHP